MAGGYIGKILNVDLSKSKIQEEVLDEGIYRDFIGGYGLGARILFSRQKPGVDPLGPENILGFATGLLTGTPALFANRYAVVAKSPLTSTWGQAHSGGDFGPYLKFSGYDAVFFSGISERPVYLFINNGKAELRDASLVWGKDTHETEDILKAELGSDIRIAMIGPSAEKLSLIAGIITSKGRAAARCGLGAVMGSKKLKAIAVKGSGKVPMANAQEVNRLRKKHLAMMKGDPNTKTASDFGTTGSDYFKFVAEDGELQFKNWAGVWPIDMPDISPLYGESMATKEEAKFTCHRCPLACSALMKAGTGTYEWEAGVHRPEYETLAQLGTLCLNSDVESIIKLNDMCNRYGIDTISVGGVLAFAMECYENGLITKEDTGGIELTWGNHRAMVAMTEKLAKREGFGDILADGVKLAAERIGKGSEQYAMHIHGQEVPAHDPRGEPFYATLYVTDATPANHCGGSEMYGGIMDEEKAKAVGFPSDGYFDQTSYAGRGETHKFGRDAVHVLNATGFCLLYFSYWLNWKDIFDYVNAVTGWGIENPDELLVCGERISNIRQAFNIREGITLQDFKIPDRIIGSPPLPAGPAAGRTVDVKLLATDFLKTMDWDLTTGKPSKDKLLSLGLKDVAAALWP